MGLSSCQPQQKALTFMLRQAGKALLDPCLGDRFAGATCLRRNPEERLVMRIERIGERTLRTEDLT